MNLLKSLIKLDTVKKTKLNLVIILYLFLLIVLGMGLVALYSSGGKDFFYKQILNITVGLSISLVVFIVNLQMVYRYAYVLYIINLLMLGHVQFFGHNAMGATRWINLFGLKFQPSESSKIILILVLSRWFGDNRRVDSFRKLILPIILTLLPIAFIVKQPDLGTGIIIFMTSGIIILMSNIPSYLIFRMISYLVFTLPFGWLSLHEYQKKRILIFMFNDDKMNSGYNIYQSQIAIGSGGKFGAGFQMGSQSQLGFLPENHTDFIFASFAEEFGLFASIVLIAFYCAITCILWFMSMKTHNKIHSLTIVGLGSLFFLHCFINIGMVMSLLPVVGIPLPFFSYGGTTLVSTLVLFGFCAKLYVTNNTEE